jgi:hypothetical protein
LALLIIGQAQKQVRCRATHQPSLGPGAHAPSNRIAVATIGVGPMGKGHLGATFNNPGFQVLASCDVLKLKLEKTAAMVNTRKRLDKAIANIKK